MGRTVLATPPAEPSRRAAERRRARNRNGAGSITLRKDGRFQGMAYLLTTAGTYKRKYVYGKSWDDVHDKLVDLQAASKKGVPIPEKSTRLGEYLTYWLAEVVKVERRAKTYQGYEGVVRLHIIPGLGKKRLDKLTAQEVRAWLNVVRDACQCCKHGGDASREHPQCCATGRCCESRLSRRMIQSIHAVLRNALEHAVREELITRNVARLVRVPAPKYRTGQALTIDQARLLLQHAREHRLYGVFALALLLGLRRAELLGLRWQDINFAPCSEPGHGGTCETCKGTGYIGGRLTVARTLQRVDGSLQLAPTKSDDSDRVLPLPLPAVSVLLDQRERLAADRVRAGAEWREHDFVFPSRIGTPLEPDNLRRAWYPIRAKLGLQMRFHDLRHTCVSLLLDLGIPPHIVREIAGHADVEITLKIYGHGAKTEHEKALGKLGDLLF